MSTPESVLGSVQLFAGLEPESLSRLESFTFRKTFAPGELIVEEGRTGNGLYVVLSGEVEVIKGLEGGRPETLAKLGAGEPFGEMALLGEWPRMASVRATTDVECLGMDRWVFLAHLNREPGLAVKMLQILAQRLAEVAERLVD
jgi:CRP/FNR family cyclic AMP-dependent transcriptional regulator